MGISERDAVEQHVWKNVKEVILKSLMKEVPWRQTIAETLDAAFHPVIRLELQCTVIAIASLLFVTHTWRD